MTTQNDAYLGIRIPKELMQNFKQKSFDNGQKMSEVVKFFINLYVQDKISIDKNLVVHDKNN